MNNVTADEVPLVPSTGPFRLGGTEIGILTHTDLLRMMKGWSRFLMLVPCESDVAFTRVALSLMPTLSYLDQEVLSVYMREVQRRPDGGLNN